MTIIPIVKRGDGVLISATPRGMWVENEHDDRDPVYILHRHFAHYRTRGHIEYHSGVIVAPAGADGMMVSWPDYPPVYLTSGDLQQVVFAIQVMGCTKRIREEINATG